MRPLLMAAFTSGVWVLAVTKRWSSKISPPVG